MTRGLINSLLAWNPAHFFYLISEGKRASTGETEDTHCTVWPMYMIWAPRCQVWDAQSNPLKSIITPTHTCEINPKSTQVFPSYYYWKNSIQIHS